MDITPKERKRHLRFFSSARWLVSSYFCKKFNFSFDSLRDIPQPYLLLANHNLNLDPVLVGIASGNQLYFVASEHITHNRFLYFLLKRYLHPIIHVKGSFGMRSAMEIMKALRAGYNVGMFPEGNRSFDGVTGEIPEVTGRLAKKSGAGLVTFRIEGGYLTQPRWGDSIRKGKTFGRKVHYYSPEKLKKMTEEEVQQAIVTDLHEDAYERQAEWMVPYKGRKLAKYMESTLFACPKCGSLDCMYSNSHSVYCLNCYVCFDKETEKSFYNKNGFKAEYDEYGYLTEIDGTKHTVRELNLRQIKLLERRVRESVVDEEAYAEECAESLFADVVRLYLVDGHKRKKLGNYLISGYCDSFKISKASVGFTEVGFEGDFRTIMPDQIKGMAIYTRNHLVVDLGETGRHYELEGGKRFNALKYLYLYRIMKNKEAK